MFLYRQVLLRKFNKYVCIWMYGRFKEYVCYVRIPVPRLWTKSVTKTIISFIEMYSSYALVLLLEIPKDLDKGFCNWTTNQISSIWRHFRDDIVMVSLLKTVSRDIRTLFFIKHLLLGHCCLKYFRKRRRIRGDIRVLMAEITTESWPRYLRHNSAELLTTISQIQRCQAHSG
jgi:hypothetical protein